MTAELVIPDKDPLVLEWRGKAAIYKAEALALEVDSDEQETAAVSMLGIGAAIEKAAEAKRDSLVRPFNDHVKEVNGFFRDVLAPFRAAREAVEPRVIAWRKKKARLKAEADAAAERERLKAAALEDEALRAEQAGETKVAAQLLDQAVVSETTAKAAAVVAAAPIRNTIVTPMGASTGQKRWTFKPIDLTQVPRDFLMLDDKAVNEWIREARLRGRLRAGETYTDLIPGLEVYQDESLAVRG